MEVIQDKNYASLDVFFSGPGSVGKTTLIHELEKYVKFEVSSEIARGIISDWNWSPDDYYPSKNVENFKRLNFEIMRRSMIVAKRMDQKNVIFDRGLDFLTYLRYYNGVESFNEAKISAETEYVAEKCQKGLVFVIYPHPKCNKSDNIRLEPKMAEQVEFVEIMINILDEFHVPYIPILYLDLNVRIKMVVKEIAKRRPDLLTDCGQKLILDKN